MGRRLRRQAARVVTASGRWAVSHPISLVRYRIGLRENPQVRSPPNPRPRPVSASRAGRGQGGRIVDTPFMAISLMRSGGVRPTLSTTGSAYRRIPRPLWPVRHCVPVPSPGSSTSQLSPGSLLPRLLLAVSLSTTLRPLPLYTLEYTYTESRCVARRSLHPPRALLPTCMQDGVVGPPS